MLINQGLDVNSQNVNHETPIHLMAHDFEKMRTMMEHSKWKRMPRSERQQIEGERRSRRRRSLDLEERGDHVHAPRALRAQRRQSEIRIRGRPKASQIPLPPSVKFNRILGLSDKTLDLSSFL